MRGEECFKGQPSSRFEAIPSLCRIHDQWIRRPRAWHLALTTRHNGLSIRHHPCPPIHPSLVDRHHYLTVCRHVLALCDHTFIHSCLTFIHLVWPACYVCGLVEEQSAQESPCKRNHCKKVSLFFITRSSNVIDITFIDTLRPAI